MTNPILPQAPLKHQVLSNNAVASQIVESAWSDPSPENLEEMMFFTQAEASPDLQQAVYEELSQKIKISRDFQAPLDLNVAVVDPQFRVNGRTHVLARGSKMGQVLIDAVPEVLSQLHPGDQVAVKTNTDGIPVIARRIGPFQPTGIRTVERILDGTRLVVNDQTGEKTILQMASGLSGDPNLEAGAQVFCVPEFGLATGVVEIAKDEQAVQLMQNIPDYTFSDLGGMPEVQRQLRRMVSVVEAPPGELKSYGLQRTQLVLFEGPPGTGKSYAAVIVAAILKRKYDLAVLTVKGPEFLNPFVGASEMAVRNLFDRLRGLAKKHELVLLIWDEFEALFHSRGKRMSGTIVDDTLVPAFISEMDGLSKNALENVWFVAISNKPELLDSAMIREGRLGQKVVFRTLQSEPAVGEVAAIHLRNRLLSQGLSAPEASERLAAFSFHGRDGVGIPVAQVRFQDGRKHIITSQEIMTGAMIAGAITRAAERAWWRSHNGGPAGISLPDLFSGLEGALSGLPLSRENLDEYLGWPVDEVARVMEVQRI